MAVPAPQSGLETPVATSIEAATDACATGASGISERPVARGLVKLSKTTEPTPAAPRRVLSDRAVISSIHCPKSS